MADEQLTGVLPLIIGAGVTLGTLKLLEELAEKKQSEKEKSGSVV